jgi:hypothetical protein
MAHQARSAKNITVGGLHAKLLIQQPNLSKVCPWDLGIARSVDGEPILYCPANYLISKDSVCTNLCLVNYPG